MIASGDLVDKALNMILGSVRFDSRDVYLKPDMYELRKRFVQTHEIGHEMLPWHRELYAFLDDKTRIRDDINDRYEREANQAAIEILAQGDRLRRQADDSPITFPLVEQLGDLYGISKQATARRIVEESRQVVALAISYRGSATGKLMPAHLYCSKDFEKRFHWQTTGRENKTIDASLNEANRGQPLEPITETDMRGRQVTLEIETLETQRAVFLIARPAPARSKLREVVALRH